MSVDARQFRLSGPPKFNDLTVRYPTVGDDLDGQWVDESVTVRMLSGEIRVIQRRFRVRFKLGWKALTPEEHAAILAEVEKATFTFTPRTAAGGEATSLVNPDGSVTNYLISYECKNRGNLQAAGRVRYEQDGRYDLKLEFESVAVFGDPLPASVGTTGGGTPGPINPGDTSQSGGAIQSVGDCPGLILFLILDPSAPGPQLKDGSDINPVADPDGIARYRVTVQDTRGYTFTIRSITLKNGGSPVEFDDGAFTWAMCELICVSQDASSPSAAGATAERDIDFGTLLAAFASDTYQIEIEVGYDCSDIDTTLTVNLIIP